jgi:hypothetical protein
MYVIGIQIYAETDDYRRAGPFVRFPLKNNHSQDFEYPTLYDTKHIIRFRWSPKWMDSNVVYQGPVGEILFRHDFTWLMDGEAYEEWVYDTYGQMRIRYTGRPDIVREYPL